MSNPGDSEGALRASKSDTSLTDSFVMVTEVDTKPRKINPQNILRDGFKWQRQLVFRSKLTMHTAYDRKDNAEPASITALAVSRYEKCSAYTMYTHIHTHTLLSHIYFILFILQDTLQILIIVFHFDL